MHERTKQKCSGESARSHAGSIKGPNKPAKKKHLSSGTRKQTSAFRPNHTLDGLFIRSPQALRTLLWGLLLLAAGTHACPHSTLPVQKLSALS